MLRTILPWNKIIFRIKPLPSMNTRWLERKVCLGYKLMEWKKAKQISDRDEYESVHSSDRLQPFILPATLISETLFNLKQRCDQIIQKKPELVILFSEICRSSAQWKRISCRWIQDHHQQPRCWRRTALRELGIRQAKWDRHGYAVWHLLVLSCSQYVIPQEK